MCVWQRNGIFQDSVKLTTWAHLVWSQGRCMKYNNVKQYTQDQFQYMTVAVHIYNIMNVSTSLIKLVDI